MMPYKLLPGECFEGDDDGDRPSVPLGVAMRIKQGRRELIFVDVNDAARTRPARRTDLIEQACRLYCPLRRADSLDLS